MTSHISRPRGMVAIADALIALDGLSEDERAVAWTWLPELIGMERQAPPSGEETAIAEHSRKHDQTLTARRQALAEEEEAKTQGETEDWAKFEHRRRYLPTLPCRLSARTGEDPDWLMSETDWLGEAKPFRFADLPELLPLFEPLRTRSILSTALATPKAEGDLDLPPLLDQLCQRRPITRLPRLPVPTTRLGVQLLVDQSESMQPYLRDQTRLVQAIRDTVGRDQAEELRFADDPAAGVGSGGRSTWRHPHTSPSAGTPVVLLSDLGIGLRRAADRSASEETWKDFARRQRQAGCPLLAVMPYDRSRVPRSLLDLYHVLPWSRTTTVATVRQWIGRGLQQRQ